MQSFLLGVAVLACPVGMGLRLWMITRGPRKDTDAGEDHGSQEELQVLRTDIALLKAQRTDDRIAGGP